MVFNKFELEILLNSVRKEGKIVEKDYIMTMSFKNKLNKNKYNDKNEMDYIYARARETSKNLQVIDELLIKLENEITKTRG